MDAQFAADEVQAFVDVHFRLGLVLLHKDRAHEFIDSIFRLQCRKLLYNIAIAKPEQR